MFHYPNFDIKYKSLRCKDKNNQDKYTYTVDEVIKRFFKKEKEELMRNDFPKYEDQCNNNKEVAIEFYNYRVEFQARGK